MITQRKRDILIGVSLLVLVLCGVWFAVGREPGAIGAPTSKRTVEAPAVNQKEKETMPEQVEVTTVSTPGPTSQEAMLREETVRAMRDNAIRNLKEGN